MGAAEPRSSRLPWAALGFACAAALASWNPVAAPLGLAVGIAAGAIGWWAWARRRGRRSVALAAALLGGLATVAAGGVLAAAAARLAAGEPPGEAVVAPRSAEEVKGLLDAAAARTRPARTRAARQLEPAGSRRAGAAGAADGGPPDEDLEAE
jgi:hypothetical protein